MRMRGRRKRGDRALRRASRGWDPTLILRAPWPWTSRLSSGRGLARVGEMGCPLPLRALCLGALGQWAREHDLHTVRSPSDIRQLSAGQVSLHWFHPHPCPLHHPGPGKRWPTVHAQSLLNEPAEPLFLSVGRISDKSGTWENSPP